MSDFQLIALLILFGLWFFWLYKFARIFWTIYSKWQHFPGNKEYKAKVRENLKLERFFIVNLVFVAFWAVLLVVTTRLVSGENSIALYPLLGSLIFMKVSIYFSKKFLEKMEMII